MPHCIHVLQQQEYASSLQSLSQSYSDIIIRHTDIDPTTALHQDNHHQHESDPVLSSVLTPKAADEVLYKWKTELERKLRDTEMDFVTEEKIWKRRIKDVMKRVTISNCLCLYFYLFCSIIRIDMLQS